MIYTKIFLKQEDILLPAPSPTDDAESKLEKSDMSIIKDVGSWSRSQSTRRKSRSVHSSFRFSDSCNDLSNVRNNAARATISSVKSRNRKEASISSSGTVFRNDYDHGYSHFYVIFEFSSLYIFNPISGFTKKRRGTSFIHVTAEAMARRRERMAQLNGSDFSCISSTYDMDCNNRSLTNLNMLTRNPSTPYSRYGFDSNSKPALRRCQSSRPAKISKPSRSGTEESAYSMQGRDRKRKGSVFISRQIEENNKPNVDHLRVHGSLRTMDTSHSEKSFSFSTSPKCDNNRLSQSLLPEKKSPSKKQSHSVVVFVEDTKEHAETKLSKDHVGMRQHSITQCSLNLENNVGVLSDVSKNILKPHTSPQPATVNVEKEFCITIQMQDENMAAVGTVQKNDRITFPTEGLSIESACSLPPERATALSSNGNEISSPISGKELEMSQNDSKNELYSFLGGGTESCI